MRRRKQRLGYLVTERFLLSGKPLSRKPGRVFKKEVRTKEMKLSLLSGIQRTNKDLAQVFIDTIIGMSLLSKQSLHCKTKNNILIVLGITH